MAYENLLAAIATLLDDIMSRPEDRAVLQEQLRRKVAELRRSGQDVPAELRQFDEDPPDPAGDDDFDNLPI